MLKKWKALIETKTNLRVKALRTDNYLQYCDKKFEDFCEKKWHFRTQDSNTHPSAKQPCCKDEHDLNGEFEVYFIVFKIMKNTMDRSFKYNMLFGK